MHRLHISVQLPLLLTVFAISLPMIRYALWLHHPPLRLTIQYTPIGRPTQSQCPPLAQLKNAQFAPRLHAHGASRLTVNWTFRFLQKKFKTISTPMQSCMSIHLGPNGASRWRKATSLRIEYACMYACMRSDCQ
ncbi:hypothetical protein K504DRAFT_218438 [Pleomassaria siparia CBS 279.74]|uniref:Uncharacterized protein n=1 Tax=Pleomassaria siparia CBS 279.74 TaxID=1314801 RepID=A0A6G1KG92_9PLEO|nr:hypothetical protein K504DRAFT_218438 [Pleomassaria siparia CBS 279.74]